uniref:Uncharacterized protein n=1 Tax=Arundo donax TaxID=35708 RepID=A0A0A9CYB8_ARUDO
MESDAIIQTVIIQPKHAKSLRRSSNYSSMNMVQQNQKNTYK